MTPYLEVIAREWAARADELAEWTYERLVNRTDVWGSYLPMDRRDRQSFCIAPFRDARGKQFLTKALLARHYAGLDGHLVSLHSVSADKTSRWLTIDIDRHERDELATQEGNLAAAIAWHDRLAAMGFDPLLFDTNGRGGYHIWLVFAEPVPTADAVSFGRFILSDWEKRGLPRMPETYPKHVPTEEGHYGDCLRLPGRHHTLEHYTRAWSGDSGLQDAWLEGSGAIGRILQTRPAPRALVPAAPPAEAAPRPPKPVVRRQRPRVCVDLDGVLAAYDGWHGLDFTGAPLPGAAEFMRRLSELADVVVFTSRCAAEEHREELGELTRPTSDLAPRLQQKVKYWLDKHGLAYAEIYIGQGKPMATAYVDDRAVACSPQKDPQAYAAALTRVRELVRDEPSAPDARLRDVVASWADLPEALREEIAARIRSATR